MVFHGGEVNITGDNDLVIFLCITQWRPLHSVKHHKVKIWRSPVTMYVYIYIRSYEAAPYFN